MSVTHYREIDPVRFENESVSGVTGRVLIGQRNGAVNFCMRLFELNPGGFTPQHSHQWEHEIFVHQGTGRVLWGGEWKGIEPGSSIFVPGGMVHQIKNTGDSPLVFVCLIPAGPPEL